MKKEIILLFIFINLIGLGSSTENCTAQYVFYYCYNVDTNQDHIVDNLDNLQDFNIDGVINQSDQTIFNTYLGCKWDSNIYFKYVDQVNLTKKATLDEVYQAVQDMGTTYGIQRLAHQYPNGTCIRNVYYEYYGDFRDLMVKTGECSYVAQMQIDINKGGNLILNKCKLVINSSTSGQYGITVNGNISIIYSEIKGDPLPNGGAYSYDFYTTNNSWVNFILKNSFISDVGSVDWTNYRGLTLNTPNVIFINNTIYKSNTVNLEIGADNIIVKDSNFGGIYHSWYNIYNRANNVTIINSNLTGDTYRDIYMKTGSSMNLINTKYNDEIGQANSKLRVFWNVGVRLINSMNQGVSGGIVTFYNNSNSITNSGVTNTSGDIEKQQVLEYTFNGLVRNYQMPYKITVTRNRYYGELNNLTMNKSQDFVFNLFSSNGSNLRALQLSLYSLEEIIL